MKSKNSYAGIALFILIPILLALILGATSTADSNTAFEDNSLTGVMLYILRGLPFIALGGLGGALIEKGAHKEGQKQQYYLEFIRRISDHNWKCLDHNLNVGLRVTNVPLNVSVVCYQHLDLILLAWLNRDIIEKDGSIAGWKNWAGEIKIGANSAGNEKFAECYRNILESGDLYPKEFLIWLKEELGFEEKVFKAPAVPRINHDLSVDGSDKQ